MTGMDELWHGERILSRDDFEKMENKRNFSFRVGERVAEPWQKPQKNTERRGNWGIIFEKPRSVKP